ncbi:MAG: hypothetical protein Q7S33_05515 [Nanoarchaeota archaeon]|nr:hypothetical protein [Nanoarchaeota archaeon]
MINLPTLQDIRKLEWLVEKGFRNWHTKNYQKGPYASGAVLHSETKDGVNRFTMIDTSLLMKFGKIAEEIEVYREQLKQDLSEENRNKILELIKERKESVKLNLSKIEAAGDFHLGAPDNLDRYSKDQFIKASQIYQLEHGLPNIVSWDEIAHGTMERTFNSASRYEGLIPEKFKQVVIDKILASDLTGEQKAYEIAKESMRNLRAITIHNNSEQKHLFKLLLKPYADKILENNGKLILTSGNHFNKSNPTSDEALEFANQFSEEYIDNGQIAVFSGKGNDVGVGALRLDNNQKIFVMHKFPERNDEIYGIMTHLRKMNNDADIVIAGDRHHPGAGYADGHFIALHPGYEPINKFVPLIGKPAGVRGFNNVFYDSDKKGVYAVEFVLNPTLEKIIEKEKII